MTISHQELKPLNYPQYKGKNLIGISCLSTPIYKYYSLKYLISTLLANKLFVGKVNNWEDVYENFLFKQDLFHKGHPVDWRCHTDGIYGQSWTECKSSDAMWRIYSHVPQTDSQDEIIEVGIRVQTTLSRLIDAVYTSDNCMADTRIGKVNYLTDNEIYKWLVSKQQLDYGSLNDTMFESLFIKRMPFIHEKEIRIIKILDSATPHHDMLSFSIPNDFFDEFVIDPRIKDNSILSNIHQILRKLSATRIRQSELYTLAHRVQFTI